MNTAGKSVVAAIATLLCVSAAHAGTRLESPVVVDPMARFAGGNLGSARNIPGGPSWMGCTVQGSNGILHGTCWARTAAGLFRKCVTTHPNMISAMSSMQGDSELFFTWDDSGNCTSVIVSNTSSAEPKIR